MERKVLNVLISSVGGQGGLTLSRVLATSAVLEGYYVRTGESLGMAQRFGSVVSYVRIGIGQEVHAPTFSLGEADYLIGLEFIETVRNLSYLRKGGTLIVDEEVKPPVSSSLGLEKMPLKEELLKELSKVGEVVIVPARKIAAKIGDYRAANMVLLGVFSKLSKEIISDDSVIEAIRAVIGPSRAEISIKAYREGKAFI